MSELCPARWGWGNPDKTFPTGHILVAVPNPLVAQWKSEALRFLDADYWNVVVYPTNKNDQMRFWEKVWDAKVLPTTMTTIVIASHTVSIHFTIRYHPSDRKQAIRSEAKMLVMPENTRSIDPETGPKLVRGFDRSRSLFHVQWAISVWDEAQWL